MTRNGVVYGRVVSSRHKSARAPSQVKALHNIGLKSGVTIAMIEHDEALCQAYAGILHRTEFNIRRISPGCPLATAEFTRSRSNIVLMRSRLHEESDVAHVRLIRESATHTAIVVAGVPTECYDVAPLLRAGASGLVSDHASVNELIATLRAVQFGAISVSGPLIVPLLAVHGSAAKAGCADYERQLRLLTKRELAVAVLVADGSRNKEIALRLRIAPTTVRAHLHAMFRKLAARSRLDVARIVLGARGQPAPSD